MTSQIALTEEIERKNKMSRLIDIDRTKVSRKFQGLSGRKIDLFSVRFSKNKLEKQLLSSVLLYKETKAAIYSTEL